MAKLILRSTTRYVATTTSEFSVRGIRIASLPPPVDISVTKSVNDPTPTEGDTITYTVIVSNQSVSGATGVTVGDTLPAGVNLVSNSGSYTGSAWVLTSLPAGASTTLTITASVNVGTAETVITNTAYLLSVDQSESNALNDVFSAVISPQALPLDFGDAPSPYPTLLADAGAHHGDIGPKFGATRDVEADGQPSSNADGDDTDGTDDENGISFANANVGQLDASLTIDLVAVTNAKVDAWIDFNNDGSWGGPWEQIADASPVSPGSNQLFYDVPSWATPAPVARFRVSTAGDLGHGGLSVDGEVQDYILNNVMGPGSGAKVFTTKDISTSANGAFSVFAADVDGDGDMDVLSASEVADEIAWYENDGSQNFTTNVISSAANGARSVFAVDLDGDGDMDVLSASSVDDKIAAYLNDGAQNFTTNVISTSANTASSVFAADINGDGHMDVLSASLGG